jgi:hypothetical protein
MHMFDPLCVLDGDIWTARGGANPSGLVVRWGGI